MSSKTISTQTEAGSPQIHKSQSVQTDLNSVRLQEIYASLNAAHLEIEKLRHSLKLEAKANEQLRAIQVSLEDQNRSLASQLLVEKTKLTDSSLALKQSHEMYNALHEQLLAEKKKQTDLQIALNTAKANEKALQHMLSKKKSAIKHL